MAKIKTINVFPPAKDIEIGNYIDNDRPIFDPIDIVLVQNAYIGYYGYITKLFSNIEQIVSPRHRYSISIKSILSNYFFKKKIKINQPAISFVNGWYENFYHFSLECLVKLYILRDYSSNATIVFPSNLSKFHKEWIEILNIKKIIYINENQVVATPLAISSNFSNRDLNHHHLILPEFKNWILSKVENKIVLSNDKIFIGRKSGSKRNLINQKELAIELNKLGYYYIEIEDFSVAEQINIFRNANFIIAVHGASLTHLTFCKQNTLVIDLIHEDYHVFCFLKLSKILNINYNLLFCKGEETEKSQAGYKDFSVDIMQVIRTVEKW